MKSNADVRQVVAKAQSFNDFREAAETIKERYDES